MAFVKEIDTKRPHQIAAYRRARVALRHQAGIILADGVGLGKTYEALATVATYLSQQEHGKERKQHQAHRVLILVPPNLVTKWASELEVDKFLAYLKGWEKLKSTQAVHRTFSDEVVVLRRFSDLENNPGELRYGKHVLPAGCYIVNWNLLFRSEHRRKLTQLHKTPWDAVIVDEAHRISGALVELTPHTLIAPHRTKTILLTATPFQLSPGEMEGLLADTFGGYGNPENWSLAIQDAGAFYQSAEFSEYRHHLARYFRTQDIEHLRLAARQQAPASRLLRERIIRNPKREKRRYFFVDNCGLATATKKNVFASADNELSKELSGAGLIQLREEDIAAYLRIRNKIAEACSEGRKPFVAAALRQLLSTYDQFRNSQFARYAPIPIPSGEHPKIATLRQLVRRIVESQVVRHEALQRGWFEKILIFTTFVGSEHTNDFCPGEKRHGTANNIKRVLEAEVRSVIASLNGKFGKDRKKELGAQLVAVVRQHGQYLDDDERATIKVQLQRFAGSIAAYHLLASKRNLRAEKRHLAHELHKLEPPPDLQNPEQARRADERRRRRLDALTHRYSTRDLVARYDGATDQLSRDRHLRGFNSPYAPLVLITSSVGQEGIDLQRYCSHVIHYDLEWNPAKLEQREGRVDRHGREAAGPVNVYFLICRDTYDERVLHVMVNRMRWHQILLPNRKALDGDISGTEETLLDQSWFRKVVLDLRPRRC